MSYLPLGSRVVTAAADTTNLNTGNLTANFSDAILGIKSPYFELYHLAIVNVPSNTTIKVYEGMQLYTVAQEQTIADWDPFQPMLLQPGQEIYICFNIPTLGATAATTPVVTAWFRRDPAISPSTA